MPSTITIQNVPFKVSFFVAEAMLLSKLSFKEKRKIQLFSLLNSMTLFLIAFVTANKQNPHHPRKTD